MIDSPVRPEIILSGIIDDLITPAPDGELLTNVHDDREMDWLYKMNSKPDFMY